MQITCVTLFQKSRLAPLVEWRIHTLKLCSFSFTQLTLGQPLFFSQGGRMDEQRCSAPQILKNLGTPSPQCKDVTSETTVKPLQRQRSGSFKSDCYWQVSCSV